MGSDACPAAQRAAQTPIETHQYCSASSKLPPNRAAILAATPAASLSPYSAAAAAAAVGPGS